MSEDPHRNKKLLALKRAIEATFDDARRQELGYLTDTVELITQHPRLLRSLYWGDPDYPACVLAIIPKIISRGEKNLKILEEYAGLEVWLKTNDPALYSELYSGELIPLEHLEDSSIILDVAEISGHAARSRKSITEDPAQAIGSAKELVVEG